MTLGACISPGVVTADDLIAYLDDNTIKKVADHLRECAHCRDEARAYSGSQQSLRSVLHRLDCPSTHLIGEYELGLAGPEQRQQIAAHIVECPRCTQDLAMMRGFLADNRALESRPRRNPLVVIAELLLPSVQPALSGLRGTDEGGDRTYRTENLTITVGAGMGSRPGRWSIVGLVLSDDGILELGSQSQAELTYSDGQTSTTELDDLGNFGFDDISSGRYGLRLILAEKTILIESLPIGITD